MKYLENDICEFKLIGNSKYYDKKTNILSCCFFKMNKHYKNFDIYINGLKKWIKFLESFEHNYIFRLFIDDNIYNDKQIMDIINSTNKIESILFSCKKYKKGNYHIDLFATLVRFFPFFNFKNNDSNNVIVVDLDFFETYNYFFDVFKYLMKNNIDQFCGKMKMSEFIGKNKVYIYANLMSYSNKFDKNIIINFIKNAENVKEKSVYNKRKTTFDYGIDEIFINDYLLKNKEKCGLIPYGISYFLYYTKNRILKSKNSKLILKYILGKFYNNHMTIKDMFSFIDKNTYKKEDNTSLYLITRFYKIISYLHDKNIKWLPRSLMNILNLYLNNLIKGDLIIFYNKNNEIINIKILHGKYL